MQDTNYVARAQALIKSTVRTAALVIMPLAAAVSAHAIPLGLPTSNLNCMYNANSTSTSGGNSCVSGGVTPNATSISGSGINGAALFFTSGGLGSTTLNFGSSGGALVMSTSGKLFTALPTGTAVPVTYDFVLSEPIVLDPQWMLGFILGDVTTSTILGTTTFSGSFSGSQTFSGGGTLTTTNPFASGDTIGLRVVFQETGSGNSNNVFIGVPPGSFDFMNFSPASSVPEPASMGLLGSGLAWLAFQWRKRRKN